MKRSKRLIAFLLSMTLALQGSMITYAGNKYVDPNASTVGSTSGKPTSSIGNGTWNLPANTGYRFTITDNQGKIVGTLSGLNGPGSLDVVNAGVKSSGLMYYGCATDYDETYKAVFMSYNTFMSILKVPADHMMPDWILSSSSKKLQGLEHRAWMMTGAGGSGGGGGLITGDSGQGQNAALNPKSSISMSGATKESTDKKVAQAEANGGVSTTDGRSTRDKYEDRKKGMTAAELAREEQLNKQRSANASANIKQQSEKKSTIYDKVKSAAEKAGSAAIKDPSDIKGMWVPRDMFNLFTITAHASGPGESGDSWKASSIDENGKIEESSGGSAVAEDYDPVRDGYAWAIINMVDPNNNYMFQLPGAASTYSESDATKKVRPGDIFIKNDYRLVVENTIQGMPQRSEKAGGGNYGSLVYGTAHNWSRFGTDKWLPWYGGGMGDTWGNDKRFIGDFLPHALVTETDWPGVLGVPGAHETWGVAAMQAEYKTGYGTHVYSPGDIVPGIPTSSTNEIRTWDKPNYPDIYGPTEWPKDIPEDDTYIEKNKSNTLKITKYYQFRDVKGNVYPLEFFNTVNAPHRVYIMDEVEGNGFKLTDWFESKDDWQPPADSMPEDNPYEQVKKKHYNTGITGTEEKLPHVIPADTETKVLHILLEFTGKPEPEKVTVIRVYDNENHETERVETEEIPEGPGTYEVPIDPEYEYVETKESPNPPKPTETWDDSEGPSKGTPPKVEYPEETKTIYIHYVKKPKAPDTKKIVLYENELSYNYDLRDLLKDRKLLTIYEYVPAPPVQYGPCTGPHHDRCSHGYPNYYCCAYTCSDDDYALTDSSYSFTVKDSFDQNTLPFIKNWTYTSKMNANGLSPKNGGGGEKYKVTPQATFLLIRDKQEDRVTLYPGKNEGIKGELQDLNLTESYTSADTRYKNKRETTKTENFFKTVYTKLGYSQREDKLAWRSWMTPKKHSKSGTYNTSPQSGHTPDDANTAYSKSDNVEIRYFLGKAGKSEEEPKDIRSAWMKKFNHNTAYSKTSANLSFYPYLKYVYYRKDSSSAEPVMVTSSNLSEFKVYNAIQAGVYKKREINANLDSTQWSTHARSLSFLKSYGISDKRSVLPGGAIMDIDTFNPGDTQIGLTIWQTCLPDTQVQAVQEGFKVSESEAREATNALIESVKKSISGYGLVQWGQTGIYKDMKSLMKVAEELHEKTRVSFVKGNNGTTQADNKYYLRHDGEGSNRANFDCLDSRIENQHVYTIYSDVEGNVWVTKDGTEIGRISKTEKADSLLSNAEIKILDDNTKVITNYVAVIQRNAGTTRDGEKWHNEAFDGVSVLMTEISFDVGFGGNSAKRTNVLDPLLTAPTQSKSDLYNFSDEDLLRSSVYVTTKTSSQADKKQEGYLGTLKGISGIGDLETGLTDIQSMVYTKNFYIPNATVSDLN